jgi:PAS domain S-box-containing protein
MAYSPMLLPFLLSGGVLLLISLYGFSRRNLPYTLVYSTIMLVASLGAFLYAMELASVELFFKEVLQKLYFTTNLVIVYCLLVIIFQLGGFTRWLAPGRFIIFLIEPLLAIALSFFPGDTQLFSYGYRIDLAGPLHALLYSVGPLYWGHLVYSYLLLAAALVLLASSLHDFRELYRRQTGITIAAIILPILADASYHVGLTVPRGLDWTPVALLLTGILTATALFRFRLAAVAALTGSVIVRTMHDLALVLDSHNRLVDFNPSALAQIGAGARRAVGHALEELPSPWGDALRPFAAAVTAQHRMRVDLPDRTRWYDVNVSALQAESQDGTMGRLFLLHDVTEREEVAGRLSESEEMFRGFIEQTFESIILFDEDGRIIEFNHGSEKLSGWSRADVLGLPAWRLMGLLIVPERRIADYESWLETRFRAALQTGTGELLNRATEETLQRPDGSRRYFRQYFFPIRTTKGFRLGSISEDITEAREAERELRKSQELLLQSQKMEAVGRLAGGIAHDFNNLLTVITGYCDMLSDAAEAGAPLTHQIAEISNAAQRATLLTSQLLAFSRKQVLQPRVISLNDLVRGVESILIRVIGEDVELITRLQPDVGGVEADQGQIEQVIMNLAVNARDAMPAGGTLTLETGRESPGPDFLQVHPEMPPGEYVRLSARDTGEGMSGDVLSRIFEPFFTTKDPGKGTGLGLSTVYGIVKQSNGYIYCSSSLSQGTTFTIYLPRFSPDDVVERLPAPRPASLRGTETILLVEDEESVRGFIRTLLERSGYAVLDASNGHEAIDIVSARGSAIHLLVTDVVMPRMSGRELAENVRSISPGIRLLYVSGYTDDAVFRHGMTEGEINFIQKPFRSMDFLRKVREILDEHPKVRTP